jgi:hypothetical protein
MPSMSETPAMTPATTATSDEPEWPRAAGRSAERGRPKEPRDDGMPTLVLERLSAEARRIEEGRSAAGSPPLLPTLGLFALALAVYWLVNGGQRANLDYFVPLADSFLHLRLDILEHPPWLNELVPFDGRYFVVYPPMPAVVLMPIVALLGPGLDQGRVSIVLGAVNVVLASGVIYRMGVRGRPWIALSLLFGFGTILWYSAAFGTAWHFAHVCATLFLFLAIRDVQLDGPSWRIGLLLGFAGLSRLPVFMAAPFFLAYIAHRSQRAAGTFAAVAPGPIASVRAIDWEAAIRRGLLFGIGVGIPVLAYGLYNLARFGSPTENGYNLVPGLLEEYQYRYGFLSLEYVGRNLFALLLSVPNQLDAFPWIQPRKLGGMSILLTTPAFLWILRARRPDWFTLGAWAAVLCTLVPILMHADPGGAQFGYRYATDVYPFLLLLLVRGMQGTLDFEKKLAIAISLGVNAWGMWAWSTGFLA